jgi:Zn-dependent peptidase ImmA (M78 family)/DNA-binding XRE family transcriptional regulator
MDINTLIPRRLRAIRETQGVTQQKLSEALGFKDRQTLTKVESQERRLSAQELVKASEFFSVPLEYFTDPFRLEGEARFSWRRQKEVPAEKLQRFENAAAGWIGLFRVLAIGQGQDPRPLGVRVPLQNDSTFEEAWNIGEAAARQLNLGEAPALGLRDAIERLGTLVLYVDAIPEVSGAACQLASVHALNVILINRKEPLYRRKFDLAHEFFHLLTWDAMPPQHFESVEPTGKEKRVERLADNFASGLLMPLFALAPHLSAKTGKDINLWLNETATILGVSSSSLRYRLVNSGLLSAAETSQIDESKLRNNGVSAANDDTPPLFSRRFMEVLQGGLKEGCISTRRACAMLNITIDELKDTFAAHQVEAPFGL